MPGLSTSARFFEIQGHHDGSRNLQSTLGRDGNLGFRVATPRNIDAIQLGQCAIIDDRGNIRRISKWLTSSRTTFPISTKGTATWGLRARRLRTDSAEWR